MTTETTLNKEISLSFEDFTSADSLEALAKLYAGRGRHFHPHLQKKELLAKIRTDWKSALEVQKEEALAKEISEKLPHIDVAANGRRYGIYNCSGTGTTRDSLLEASLKDYNHWVALNPSEDLKDSDLALFEECGKTLARTTYLPHTSGLEPKIGKILLEGGAGMGISGFLVPIVVAAEVAKWSFIAANLPWYLLYKFFLSGGSRKDKPSEEGEQYTLHPEAVGEMPAYVELGSNENNLGYKQRKSAHLAEFAKAWKPDEDKGILVGKEQVPQIKYFLANGVKNSKIVERVQTQVGLLKQDPEAYAKKVSKLESTYNAARCTGLCVPIPVGLGLLLAVTCT